MATTKIWDVRAHIGKLIAYVTNRDKTTMAIKVGGDREELRLAAESDLTVTLGNVFYLCL